MFSTNQIGIIRSAAAECRRQNSGEDSVGHLLAAYNWAYNFPYIWRSNLTPGVVMQIACIVEPKENLNGAYRKVPVTFQNGGSSVTAGEIARQVNLLHEAWNEGRINAEEFVKRYLEIHPWRDGNGRTMWVVYNKIRLPDNGGMIYPQPVPEFSFT